MKTSVIFLLLLSFLCGNAGATISFTDSITGVTLNLPDSAVIKESSKVAYKKLSVELPGGAYLSAYSVRNPNDETYTWSYMNDFDKSYGTPFKKEKLSGDVDGWRRIYGFKTADGTPYVRCVTLIRGENYAFYIEENALSVDKLISPELVQNSVFPATVSNSFVEGRRQDAYSNFKDFISGIVLILLGIALRFVRESLSHVSKWAIILLFGTIQFVVDYKIIFVAPIIYFFSGGLILIITYLLLYCPTWDDFFNRLEKNLSKFAD